MPPKIIFLLLFLSITIKNSFSQCKKNYELLVNSRFTYKYLENIGSRRESYNLCNGSELSFVIKNPDPNTILRIFRNDTLEVDAKYSGVKFSRPGIYKVQLIDNDCLYEMGKFNVAFSDKININIYNYTSNEIISCDGIASGFLMAYIKEDSNVPLTYQWYLNGKALDFAKGESLYPNKPGIYTVSGSKQSCYGVSAPLEIKEANNYIINGKLSISGGYRNLELNTDTITLCKNEKYTLQSNQNTTWYKDGVEIAKNTNRLSIAESGSYSTKRPFYEKCEYREKVFAKFENEVLPPKLTTSYFDCLSNQFDIESPSFVSNNSTVTLTSKSGSAITYNLFGPSFDIPIPFSSYSINIKTGSCTSKKVEISSEKKLELVDFRRKKIGGKKNSSLSE